MLAGKVEDMINTVVRQIAFYEFERRVLGPAPHLLFQGLSDGFGSSFGHKCLRPSMHPSEMAEQVSKLPTGARRHRCVERAGGGDLGHAHHVTRELGEVGVHVHGAHDGTGGRWPTAHELSRSRNVPKSDSGPPGWSQYTTNLHLEPPT